MHKIILLDLDETLVDTREHVLMCNLRTLKANGHDVTYEQLKKEEKWGSLKACREKLGMDDEEFYTAAEGVMKHRIPMAESIAKGYVHLISGAKEFIRDAHRHGYKLAIVTNTDEAEIKEKIKLLDIKWEDVHGKKHVVGTIIGAEQGEVRKPDPRQALAALRQLGVNSPADAKVYLIGDGSTDMGCGLNLRKLGYNVTNILFNHYDDEYARSINWHDAVISSWDDARKLLL